MKSTSSAMNTHIQGEVTTLATCFRLTRLDLKRFHFTEHDLPLSIDLDSNGDIQIYKPSSSYNRSAFRDTASLAVDNLDITGVLDDADIPESELRRGLFDFATIEIFLVNHQAIQPILGTEVIKLRKGTIGEVTITRNGFFQAELRGVLQAYSQKIGELYSPECRADLGDTRCKIPLQPSLLVRNTSYVLGDFVRTSNDFSLCVIVSPFDTTSNDRSPLQATGTSGSEAAIQTTTFFTGTGAVEFTPTASVDPSNAFVSYPDNVNYTIGTNQFTIEGHVRFKDLTDTFQTIASHWLNTGNQKAWAVSRNGGNLEFRFTTDGSTEIAVVGAFTFSIDTWYHIAVTRDGSNDVRLFVDGTQVGITSNQTGSLFNSTEVLRVGKVRNAGGDDNPLFGFIDDFRFCIGKAIYTSNFTKPSTPHTNIDNVIAEDLDDRIYVVTVAGTTAAVQPTFDTTVTNTTIDGGVTFTAEEAWSRAIEVTAVSGSRPRRTFTVTELTPNTGGPRGGFPNDWFNGGAVTWESGLNSGVHMEVRDFIADDGVTITQDIELFLDLPFDIAIGDKARIYPGCDKSLFSACRDKFNNVINFRGEPFIPGSDFLFTIPDAKA